MIKILHVLTDTNIGGAGRYLFNLLALGNEKGFKVMVACPGGGELEKQLKSKDIKVFALSGGERSVDFRHIRELRQIISREKIDIVHTHASFSGRIAGRLGGCKIVMTRHSLDNTGNSLIRRVIVNLISRIFTDEIIAVSRAVKINLMDSGVPANMITIIYNGIDISKFENTFGTLREELGIGRNTPIIGIVARLVREKGCEYAINAFYRVLKVFPLAKLIIIGDGPLRESLQDICHGLGIKDQVIFTGYRKKIENLVTDFDVFVLPSISEGLGLALLEAMALGKPAIATITGGIPEIIKHNVNGLLVPPGNDIYLADSIVEFLSNKSKAKALGIAAKNTVREKFSSEKMIAKTKEIYLGLHN